MKTKAKEDLSGSQKSESKKILVKSEAKFLKMSPRKLRLVANAVKKLIPEEAMRKLRFLNKKGAIVLSKVIKTAVYDAKNNFKLSEASLRFKRILVNEGPMVKRADLSHGARFNPGMIHKKMSHVTILIEGDLIEGEKQNG